MIGRPPTHGLTHSREYDSWRSMRARCNRETAIDYNEYGGRGIKVCERWDRFENFYEDMGERPEGTTIDRINNDGDYTKDNCRWATYEEQNRNRSTTVLTLDDAKEIIRLHKSGIFQRVIADKYGITQSMVSYICSGKTWAEAQGE